MAPPVLSRIKDVISVNYFNSKNENNKEDDEEIRNIRLQARNCKSGFFLSRDNSEDDNKNKYMSSVESEMVF